MAARRPESADPEKAAVNPSNAGGVGGLVKRPYPFWLGGECACLGFLVGNLVFFRKMRGRRVMLYNTRSSTTGTGDQSSRLPSHLTFLLECDAGYTRALTISAEGWLNADAHLRCRRLYSRFHHPSAGSHKGPHADFGG